MKIGNFKFGNDYKFDMKDVIRRPSEDINKLNKIELRYNTRKNLPTYPAMKSLYRWRSVFGYRLGGALRQAVVKLAELKRPIVNAHNLVASMPGGQLHTYKRLYSSRQVMKAVQSANLGSSQVKMLKYVSFGQIPRRMHELASDRDHSVRNKIMQKFMGASQNKETEKFFQEHNNSIDKHNESRDLFGSKVSSFDVEAKMKEVKGQKSDSQICWENNKERIAFKANNQKHRLASFFSEWKAVGLKEAYSRLVDRSKKDEQDYQSLFNRKTDTVSPHIVHYDIGSKGEKVLKEFDGDKRLQEDKLRGQSDNLPPLDTKAYPWHLEDLAQYDDKLRDRLADIRKNLGMEGTHEMDI